jgi:hypothetical protein
LVLGVVTAAGVFGSPAGCSSAGIAIKESLGYAKREQLVDKVQTARDAQAQAKQQFSSALAEFVAVTKVEVKDLETQYETLRAAAEKADARASAVSSRIRDVERVADALFSEWKKELSQYKSDSLRSASERQLNETRSRYDQLLSAMKQAESKMRPVQDAFHDQVLFLKHNLNARAIAALDTTVSQIQSDVSSLISDMEASIAEANRFIDQMQAGAK